MSSSVYDIDVAISHFLGGKEFKPPKKFINALRDRYYAAVIKIDKTLKLCLVHAGPVDQKTLIIAITSLGKSRQIYYPVHVPYKESYKPLFVRCINRLLSHDIMPFRYEHNLDTTTSDDTISLVASPAAYTYAREVFDRTDTTQQANITDNSALVNYMKNDKDTFASGDVLTVRNNCYATAADIAIAMEELLCCEGHSDVAEGMVKARELHCTNEASSDPYGIVVRDRAPVIGSFVEGGKIKLELFQSTFEHDNNKEFEDAEKEAIDCVNRTIETSPEITPQTESLDDWSAYE